MLLLILFFVLFIFKFYLSSKNIRDKSFNRTNIDQILKKRVKDLPIIVNDTNGVIEFNNSLDNQIENEKKRSFWDLLKSK